MSEEKIGKLIEAMDDERFYSITDDHGQPFLSMTPVKGKVWKLWYKSISQPFLIDDSELAPLKPGDPVPVIGNSMVKVLPKRMDQGDPESEPKVKHTLTFQFPGNEKN